MIYLKIQLKLKQTNNLININSIIIIKNKLSDGYIFSKQFPQFKIQCKILDLYIKFKFMITTIILVNRKTVSKNMNNFHGA